MAKSFLLSCSILFIFIHMVLSFGLRPSKSRPSKGNNKVKCPYKKVNLKWFTGTVNPCPGLYQPICGTNFVTYDNPCILCIESLKSEGKIKFYKDGNCY
uniref:Serine peptidase inhibitor Kazal type 14 (putative) n=1 Tax=Microcebus murinus TaxID=30608 RepID=A0A8C5UUX9_MICMU